MGEAPMDVVIVVVGLHGHLSLGDRRHDRSSGSRRGDEERLLKRITQVVIPIVRAGVAEFAPPGPASEAQSRVEVDGGVVNRFHRFLDRTDVGWPVLGERSTVWPSAFSFLVGDIEIASPM